jgi:hypothetical protein
MANSLRVTELDFDTIKQNLKNYLKAQSEFTDYDFEGSGLSVLIDILAYNTHYNAFYANMALNELFLDTAVKRESVVSLAKLLNYTPRSIRAASAKLNLTVNSVIGSPSSLAINRYTPFTSTIGGTTYTFYNIEPQTIVPVGGIYSFDNLDVFEGTYVANKFTVGSTPGPNEKFEIPNVNVDTTTIRVTVQDTSTSTISTTYTLFAGDITQVTENSTIYYLDQNVRGLYEIYFGDGVLGSKLVTGNQVTIEYLVTSGPNANISDKITQTFALSGAVFDGTTSYSDVTVVTAVKSTDGQTAETIDEIRFSAPKAATAQNRLVSKYDYESFLTKNYNYVDAVSVWGGEDNDPPQYGKVYISIVPKPSQFLTTTRKNAIVTAINEKRSLAITPTFVDPDIFYLNVSSVVKYNPNITNEGSTDVSTAVTIAIQNYFQQNLGSFKQDFALSKLLAAIDDSRESIIGNISEITVQKKLNPTLGVGISNKIKLSNKIEENSFSSTQFYYSYLDTVYAARIKDIPDAATVRLSGTYRRSGALITCTFEQEHGLTEGETITLDFSGAAIDGIYSINTIESLRKFTLISEQTGNDSGTVTVQSEDRGRLLIYSVDDNSTLNNNIGFISYQSGLIQLTDLTVTGFLVGQTTLNLYFKLTKDSQDIIVARNQIIKLETESANNVTNRLAGITVSTQAVPK